MSDMIDWEATGDEIRLVGGPVEISLMLDAWDRLPHPLKAVDMAPEDRPDVFFDQHSYLKSW